MDGLYSVVRLFGRNEKFGLCSFVENEQEVEIERWVIAFVTGEKKSKRSLGKVKNAVEEAGVHLVVIAMFEDEETGTPVKDLCASLNMPLLECDQPEDIPLRFKEGGSIVSPAGRYV